MASSSIAARLINICIMTNGNNIQEPFSTLLHIKSHKEVIDSILNSIKATLDNDSKRKLSILLQKYINEIESSIEFPDDDYILSIIFTLNKETPRSENVNDIVAFSKSIELLFSKLKKLDQQNLFQTVISHKSPNNIITLSQIPHFDKEVVTSLTRIIIASLQDTTLYSLFAANELLLKHDPKEFTEDAKKSINPIAFSNIISASLMSNKIQLKLLSIDLLESLFSFFDSKVIQEIMPNMITSIIFTLRELEKKPRIKLMKALVHMPNDSGTSNEIVIASAYRFESFENEYEEAALSFLVSRCTSNESLANISETVASLIKSEVTYTAGVVFMARLGSFGNQTLQRMVFGPSEPSKVAVALQAICVMCKHCVLTPQLFKLSFQLVSNVLRTPKLLDNLGVQDYVFMALQLMPPAVAGFVSAFFGEAFFLVQRITDSEVLLKIAACICEVSARFPDELPLKISAQEFAAAFTFPAVFLLENEKDKEVRRSITGLLVALARSGFQSSIQIDEEEYISKTISKLIPNFAADAVRVECSLISNMRPAASRLALILPGADVYFSSLVDTIRASPTPIPQLAEQFMIDGVINWFDKFIPFLPRFLSDYSIVSKGLIFTSNRTIKGYVEETLHAVTAATRHEGAAESARELLSVFEAAIAIKGFEASKAAFETASALLDVPKPELWPMSIVCTLSEVPSMAPLFERLIARTEKQSPSLLKSLITSYVRNASETGFSNESFYKCVIENADDDVCSSLLSQSELLSSSDPVNAIRSVNQGLRVYRNLRQKIPLHIAPFVNVCASSILSSSFAVRQEVAECLLCLVDAPMDERYVNPYMTQAEIVESSMLVLKEVISRIDVATALDIAIDIVNTKAFELHHSLIFNVLALKIPNQILDNKMIFQCFVSKCFNHKMNTDVTEMFMINLETALAMFTENPKVFMQRFLEIPQNSFVVRVIEYMLTSKYREQMLEEYDQVSRRLQLPSDPGEQTAFLQSGYFRILAVFVGIDSKSDAIDEMFGKYMTYIIMWVSHLFQATAIGKAIQESISNLIVSTTLILFSRSCLIKPDPVEFVYSDLKLYFRSMGTLTNALMSVRKALLKSFALTLKEYVKGASFQFAITVGGLMGMLLRRASRAVSYGDDDFLYDIYRPIAAVFAESGEEVCRVVAAMFSEIFDSETLKQLAPGDVTDLVAGAVRGMDYPSKELHEENERILQRAVLAAPWESVEPQVNRIWQIALASRDFELMAYLIERQPSLELPTQTLSEAVVNTTMANTQRLHCAQLLMTLTGTKTLEDATGKLEEALGDRFESLRADVLERINNNNATMLGIDMTIALTAGDAGRRLGVVDLLLSIINDPNNPLREHAAKRLSEILNSE